MTTRITPNARITVPKKIRDALQLAPGDGVQFSANGAGQVVISKMTGPAVPPAGRKRSARPRIQTQTRRRAAELLRLLRGLD